MCRLNQATHVTLHGEFTFLLFSPSYPGLQRGRSVCSPPPRSNRGDAGGACLHFLTHAPQSLFIWLARDIPWVTLPHGLSPCVECDSRLVRHLGVWYIFVLSLQTWPSRLIPKWRFKEFPDQTCVFSPGLPAIPADGVVDSYRTDNNQDLFLFMSVFLHSDPHQGEIWVALRTPDANKVPKDANSFVSHPGLFPGGVNRFLKVCT